MLRMLRNAVLVLLLAIGGILAYASFQPVEFHIERSVATKASAETIYAVISDLNKFKEWSPWQKFDPTMKTELVGTAGAIGSSYVWDGNDKVGAGRMTITKADPTYIVEIKLEFLRPFATTNITFWRIDEDYGQRRITWAMDGKNESIFQRALGVIMDMDKLVGKDFENGLASLKQVVESK